MIRTYITLGILTIIMAAAVVYGILESGSPFETRNKKFDQQRVTEIAALKSAVQSYYYKYYRLPNKLDDLKEFGSTNITDPETKQEYEYIKEDGTAYKLCAIFLTDSTKEEDDKRYNYSSGYNVQYKHPKGHHCFDLNASQNTYRNNNTPVPTVSVRATPTADSGGNLSCTTLDTIMLLENGMGTIGCDVKVEGDFDLSRSYCQGQKTLNVQSLKPDIYQRPNRYFATLKNLDTKEEVKIFIYSKSGEKIECKPSLNKT